MYLQVQVHVRYLAAQIFQTCKGAALDSPVHVQFDLGTDTVLDIKLLLLYNRHYLI